MNGSNRRPSIVVATTCFADANPAIHLAIFLAQRMNSEVKAVLIEDDAILRTAALPFSRALYPTENTSIPVTPQGMTAAYHRDASLIEGRLASASRRASVSWSFERQSGRIRTLLQQSADLGDLVLVGHSRSQKEAREIVLFFGGRASQNSLIKLGLDIAEQTNSVLRVFTPAPVQDIVAELENRASKQHMLAEKVIFQNDINAGDHFLTHIAKSRPSAVLVGPENAIILNAEKLADIARCPVIIDNRGHDDNASS